MTKSQMDLFNLIREMTESSMKASNEILLQFTNSNSSKSLNIKDTVFANIFDSDMQKLQKHLTIWFDLYKSNFNNNPKCCLVYVADERNLGIGFPIGIEQRIERFIQEIDSKGFTDSN